MINYRNGVVAISRGLLHFHRSDSVWRVYTANRAYVFVREVQVNRSEYYQIIEKLRCGWEDGVVNFAEGRT